MKPASGTTTTARSSKPAVCGYYKLKLLAEAGIIFLLVMVYDSSPNFTIMKKDNEGFREPQPNDPGKNMPNREYDEQGRKNIVNEEEQNKPVNNAGNDDQPGKEPQPDKKIQIDDDPDETQRKIPTM